MPVIRGISMGFKVNTCENLENDLEFNELWPVNFYSSTILMIHLHQD